MALLQSDDKEFTIETREVSTAHLLIKIDSFSLLSENGISEYESREFAAGDHKWKLIIYPNGDESGMESDHISVYLLMVDNSALPVACEVNAMFSIFLLDQLLDNYVCFRGKVRRFHAMNPKWGFSNLISKKSLTDPTKGYLVGDKCVFGAEVFVIKSQLVIDRVSVLKITHAYKHDLVISQFSKLGDEWNSEEFTAGDYRWKIWLYPNGYRRGAGHSVSIYAHCVDCTSFESHEKVMVDISICMKNKIHEEHCTKKGSRWYSKSHSNLGYHEFIPIGDLRDPSKGFLVDDCCFLETEICVKAVVAK